MFCKFCGSQIDDDSVFCNKCGKEQSVTSTSDNTVAEAIHPNTIQCPSCDKTINAYSVVCEYCNYQIVTNNKSKKIITIICVVVGLILFTVLFTYFFSQILDGVDNRNLNKTSSLSASHDKKDKALITYDEYTQIETGMSYDEVCGIIGSYGEEMSRAEYEGYQTVVITWNGDGVLGANAVITFQNNAVFAKSQIGLE